MNSIIEWLLGYKPGELASGGDWRLGFLTGDYGEWFKFILLAALAVLAGLVYLTIRSYRREGDAPRKAKITLACLRIAVIVLVFLVLLRPAIVVRLSKTMYSRVIVLVDNSMSMGFKDRYAGDAALRDATARFADVMPQELPNVSRMDIARKALSRAGGVLEKLAADHPVSIYEFSGSAQKVMEIAVHDHEGKSKTPASMPADLPTIVENLKAAGFETNIPAAIRYALDRTEGQRVAGIVVLSDGQMTSENSDARLGSALASANQRHVPLYAVAVGDPAPPKNIAVTSLRAPAEVRRGARAEFVAQLAHRNLAGQSVKVSLLARKAGAKEWVDTGAGKTVKLEGASDATADRSAGVQTVEMGLEAGEIGEFDYKAVAEPRPDEINLEDNSALAHVQISDERIRVLLIGGGAGWEFQYLRNLLHTQSDSYRVSIWQQNADKELNQTASTGMKLGHMPRNLEELIGKTGDETKPGYDVIILIDPQPTQEGFDEEFAKLLRAFVERHGGGLCYVTGSKYAERVMGDKTFSSLADMLPVALAANTVNLAERIGERQPQPWPVRLTAYGLDHPAMRLGGTAEETGLCWGALPGVFWTHPVARVKPAARVLAESSDPVRRTAKNEAGPLIAVQTFGRGRVLYMGFDETWRWRLTKDGYYYRRFWTNAVRFLATLKARRVVITAGGERFATGERLNVEAEAYDEKYNPLTEKTFDVEMVNVQTGAVQKITLQAQPDKPGHYKAPPSLLAEQTGEYDLTALRGDPQQSEKVASKRIRIELPQAEAQRTEADETTLQTIATRPENFLRAASVDKLAEMIPPGRLTAYAERPRELWDTRLTLVMIVVLLSAEWILRKKYNMA